MSLESYYAARAPEYDRVYRKPERQADLRNLRGWLPALFAGKRVLELACGTGYWTQFLAPVAASVVALDRSPETLAIAKTRVPEGKATLITGDAYALPPGLGAFDAAFAGFWISHVPVQRRRDFFEGLRDALEPGATVALVDNLCVPGSSTPVAERDAEGNTYQHRTLEDGSWYRVMKNFPGEAELRASLVGLAEEIEFTALEYYWVVRYVSRKGR